MIFTQKPVFKVKVSTVQYKIEKFIALAKLRKQNKRGSILFAAKSCLECTVAAFGVLN
jgi:hypothetical protein